MCIIRILKDSVILHLICPRDSPHSSRVPLLKNFYFVFSDIQYIVHVSNPYINSLAEEVLYESIPVRFYRVDGENIFSFYY